MEIEMNARTHTTKGVHGMFYVENPNGKNHGSPQIPNYHDMRGIQSGDTKAMTSCSWSLPGGGYNCVSNTQIKSNTEMEIEMKARTHITKGVHMMFYVENPNGKTTEALRLQTITISLSHIYTHVALGLFTNIASVGLL